MPDLRLPAFLLATTGFCSPLTGQEGTAASENMYSVAYEFYGRSPYPITSRGARISYLPAGGSEIEVSHVRSSYTVLMTDFQYRETSLTMKARSGRYITLTGGLGYRTANLTSDVSIRSADEAMTSRVTVEEDFRAITANFGLGCEYAVSRNFLLGFDLFSVSSPVYTIKKTDNFPDNSAEYEEDPKSLPFIRDGLGTSYQMVRSYIKVRL